MVEAVLGLLDAMIASDLIMIPIRRRARRREASK